MRIKLQEYGEPVVQKLDTIDLVALAEANKRWRSTLGLSGNPIRIQDIGNGFVELRAEAVTGVVRVGDIDIEIAPKFLKTEDDSWQSVLWRILTVVEGGLIDDRMTSAHHSASLSIPDLLAEVFLASYAKGASRGLPRGYLSERREGSTLRGRLDTSRIGEWFARPWILPYISDDLTDNTALARLLRWSAECLSETVQAAARARALRVITGELAHVSNRPPRLAEAQKIPLGLQYKGLEAAKMVGILLLEGAGIHHSAGEHKLSGFLWNSNTIYENYVYWLCRRAASHQGKRINKSESSFGHVLSGQGSKLKTTPDVVFYNTEGVPIAIADAKYKNFGSRPKASDTYQIITAAHVLGCTRVSLTYPVSVDHEPTVWLIKSALGSEDIELTALPLNLMGLLRPRGQEALIDTIGDWLVGNSHMP